MPDVIRYSHAAAPTVLYAVEYVECVKYFLLISIFPLYIIIENNSENNDN